MPTEITMPRLSDTMSEGTVAKWRKEPGQQVAKGDIIVEIETDKATMELEAFQAGVLGQILVPEGQTVEIGVPIAMLLAPGEESNVAQAPPPASAPPTARPEPVEGRSPAPPPPQATQPEGRLRVSPLARRIAEEQRVDLRQVKGTGPGGRITRDDVEKFAGTGRQDAGAPRAGEAPALREITAFPVADEEDLIALSQMQQTIVRRMLESKQTAPEFFVTVEIDMGEAVALRRSLNAALEGEQGISFNDLVIRAAALALRSVPSVNMCYRDGKFVRHSTVSIGIAVAMPDALVVPVLKNVDRKTVREISREARELIERARDRKLGLQEMEGSTFTVSNLGMYDVDQFTAIINQPNSAILAIGAIQKKPVVKEDQIVVGERMRVTLSADHRVVYGAPAAEFLRELKRLLERPLLLLV